MGLFIRQEFSPYFQTITNAPFGVPSQITVQPNQVPVWLSFLARKPSDPACLDEQPPPSAIFFGAIFDNGHGHTLAMAPRHLGLSVELLTEFIDTKRQLSLRSSHGQELLVSRLIGDLWIHSNIYANGAGRPLAIRFSLGVLGVACYPDEITVRHIDGREDRCAGGPRVPILGGLPMVGPGMDVCLKYSIQNVDKRAVAEFSCQATPTSSDAQN